MNRLWPLAFCLVACAPATLPAKAPPTTSQNVVWSSFSAQGVVYSNTKGACVARWPDMVPRCPALGGPAGAVAWDHERAWVHLPRTAQAVTLDGPPQNLHVGEVAFLGSEGAYLANGDLMNWRGEVTSRLSRPPRAFITAGEWGDAFLTENALQHWKNGRLVESLPFTGGGVPRSVHGGSGPNVRLGQRAGFEAFGVLWEREGDTLIRDKQPLLAARPVVAAGVSGGRVWALLGDKNADPSTWRLRPL